MANAVSIAVGDMWLNAGTRAKTAQAVTKRPRPKDQSGALPPSYRREYHQCRWHQEDLPQKHRSPKHPAVSARHLVRHCEW